MNAYIIYPDGTILETEPHNGKDFKLDELQEIVGGYIEIISLNNNKIMVLNEEGKIDGLPLNQKATELADRNDFIVGTVLICNTKMVK